MMTLDEIGLKHGTDKASSFHNYLVTYEKYFAPMRELPIALLELGVYKGQSLMTWREYFPNATITGIDFDMVVHPPGTRVVFGNTNSERTWNCPIMCGRKFHIIIDDGDHHAEAQEKAFEFGWQKLVPGGLYIVEDIFFSAGGIMPFVQRLVELVNANWQHIHAQKPAIAFLHCYDGLLVIGKPQADGGSAEASKSTLSQAVSPPIAAE